MKGLMILSGALCVLAGSANAEFGQGPSSSSSGFQASEPHGGGSPASPSNTWSYVTTCRSPDASSKSAGSDHPKPRTYGAPPPLEAFKPFEGYHLQPRTSIFGPGKAKR